MIKEAVDRWETNKQKISDTFAKEHISDYKALVKVVIENITSEDDYSEFNPSPDRIHQIDDGDYQGTLVFVIAAKSYQPSDYWYVRVSYGSCSGCDTLQAISGYSDEKPTEKQVKEYMTLALHVVQGLKLMGDDAA